MFKNHFWYFVAQLSAIIIAIIAFFFLNEIQRGAYMLNFIVLGYIVKRLIEIRQSKHYHLRKTIPSRRVLVFLLLCLAIFGFIVFGLNHSFHNFAVSLICGTLGLLILIYISIYVKEIQ